MSVRLTEHDWLAPDPEHLCDVELPPGWVRMRTTSSVRFVRMCMDLDGGNYVEVRRLRDQAPCSSWVIRDPRDPIRGDLPSFSSPREAIDGAEKLVLGFPPHMPWDREVV